MKTRWLKRQGSSRLILLFGGWATGSSVFESLQGSDDVLVVDDYRHLDLDPAVTDRYDTRSVLAYSFGVVSALHWFHATGYRPDRLVAVNGTPFPSCRDKGIDPDVLVATTNSLSQETLARFFRRCGMIIGNPNPDMEGLREELAVIIRRGAAAPLPFDRIWISTADRIIPSKAQTSAWSEQESAIRYINAPHQPFDATQSWEDWLT
ncbi:pimeloyl-ACP methyl esterase BioG family protein [Roseibium sp. RKSG952]|uniref:pimeloyl-ACP methyl esterase BioG family protein n=1 Tax=Roseibium sp. RKSG952 TaxID=2529384 RepID=UPI0012BBE653|nr:pimeloyl-ACP methyl esterase BioG family protein [Roseibium sp. RKSG952]MTH95232.1 DUF452 family protein [Roseibium sp. RKSG952]